MADKSGAAKAEPTRRIRGRLRDKYGLGEQTATTTVTTTPVQRKSVSQIPEFSLRQDAVVTLLKAYNVATESDFNSPDDLPEVEKNCMLELLKAGGLLSTELSVLQAASTIKSCKCNLSQYSTQLQESMQTTAMIELISNVGHLDNTPKELSELAAAIKLNLAKLDSECLRFLKCFLCLDDSADVYEMLLLVQVLALELEDAENSEQKPESDPRIMKQKLEKLMESLVTGTSLIYYVESPERPNLHPEELPLTLRPFSEIIFESSRAVRINPSVAYCCRTLLGLEDADWLTQTRALALDALYALCGHWTHYRVGEADPVTKQFFINIAMHAEEVTVGLTMEFTTNPLMFRELGAVHMSLAFHAVNQNNLVHAEKHCRKALEALAKSNDSAAVLQTSYYLGNVLMTSGNLDGALDQHCECLAARKNLFEKYVKDDAGSDEDEEYLTKKQEALRLISSSHQQIGGIYFRLKSNKKALQHFTEAIALKRRFPEPDLESVAISINSKGYVLQTIGNLEEALNLFQEELGILREVHGGNLGHPQIKTCLQQLMTLKKSMNTKQPAAPTPPKPGAETSSASPSSNPPKSKSKKKKKK
eukprot:m.57951 g.57951  ORF g.57951 m.57951 type:complete len:591 (+) comp11143_c0_seq2:150-1922(+)